VVMVSALCFFQCFDTVGWVARWTMRSRSSNPRDSLLEQMQEDPRLTQIHMEKRPLNGSSSSYPHGVGRAFSRVCLSVCLFVCPHS